jgi:hypothetical protein
MSWSGEHRGFVIEAFFKNNDSVTATQRAFQTRFGREQAKFSVLGRQ